MRMVDAAMVMAADVVVDVKTATSETGMVRPAAALVVSLVNSKVTAPAVIPARPITCTEPLRKFDASYQPDTVPVSKSVFRALADAPVTSVVGMIVGSGLVLESAALLYSASAIGWLPRFVIGTSCP